MHCYGSRRSYLQTKTQSKPYLTELEKGYLWCPAAVMMASVNLFSLGQGKNVAVIQLMKLTV